MIIFHDAERLPFIRTLPRKANFFLQFFSVRLFTALRFSGICVSNRTDVQKTKKNVKQDMAQ